MQFAVIPVGCVRSTSSNIIKWATLYFSVYVDGVMTPCMKVHSCKECLILQHWHEVCLFEGVCSARVSIFKRLITPIACTIGNLIATLHSWNVMWELGLQLKSSRDLCFLFLYLNWFWEFCLLSSIVFHILSLVPISVPSWMSLSPSS